MSAKGGQSVQADSNRFTLFSKPTLRTPNTFSGESDWEEFSFQFKAYVDVLAPGVSEYLSAAESQASPIDGFTSPSGPLSVSMLDQLSREIRLLL